MFDLGQKFGFKKLSTLLIGIFFDRSEIFKPDENLLQKFESSLESKNRIFGQSWS